ncbi:octopine dehydrogenase-like [Mizuhopecten yessoensis]|uniref:Octopine dehydrogenase n=1 Tax=Mizuhopecten yessoensis TaxID=6573 RepID=A0A210Q7R9_MIZYE|nr:octopine dehydrogenase-like [Mizuhopecten yessoensis]OWF44774.1 Octopine dehydrogenase [Mizuhopecten yessoensis]
MSGNLVLCVCGGGSGAHALAGMAAQKGVEVRVLTLYEDEAKQWSRVLKKEELTVVVNESNRPPREVTSKPNMVTKDPEKAIPDSNVIIFTVPASVHEIYLKTIAEYIGKRALVVGLPGQAGFEFQCRDILGEKASYISIMSFESLPWECRVREFGKRVEILGTKMYLTGSLIRGKSVTKPPLMTLQKFLGSQPILRQSKHFLETIIMSYSFFHPAIFYGKWKDWDGKPVSEAPLFYHGIDEATAELLQKCSDECMAVASSVLEAAATKANLSDVKDIHHWFMENYKNEIEESCDLFHSITTNKAYQGLTHPMKEVFGGMEPDFSSRYLTEELPMGLVVFRGLADVLGVQVPHSDMLIEWGQEKMGKEYLVGGKLTGKDIDSTRCPQRYGFTTLEAILTGEKSN